MATAAERPHAIAADRSAGRRPTGGSETAGGARLAPPRNRRQSAGGGRQVRAERLGRDRCDGRVGGRPGGRVPARPAAVEPACSPSYPRRSRGVRSALDDVGASTGVTTGATNRPTVAAATDPRFTCSATGRSPACSGPESAGDVWTTRAHPVTERRMCRRTLLGKGQDIRPAWAAPETDRGHRPSGSVAVPPLATPPLLQVRSSSGVPMRVGADPWPPTGPPGPATSSSGPPQHPCAHGGTGAAADRRSGGSGPGGRSRAASAVHRGVPTEDEVHRPAGARRNRHGTGTLRSDGVAPSRRHRVDRVVISRG